MGTEINWMDRYKNFEMIANGCFDHYFDVFKPEDNQSMHVQQNVCPLEFVKSFATETSVYKKPQRNTTPCA